MQLERHNVIGGAGYLQSCLGTEAKGVKMFQPVYSALHVAAVDPHIGCLGGHSSEGWGDRWREGGS